MLLCSVASVSRGIVGRSLPADKSNAKRRGVRILRSEGEGTYISRLSRLCVCWMIFCHWGAARTRPRSGPDSYDMHVFKSSEAAECIAHKSHIPQDMSVYALRKKPDMQDWKTQKSCFCSVLPLPRANPSMPDEKSLSGSRKLDIFHENALRMFTDSFTAHPKAPSPCSSPSSVQSFNHMRSKAFNEGVTSANTERTTNAAASVQR